MNRTGKRVYQEGADRETHLDTHMHMPITQKGNLWLMDFNSMEHISAETWSLITTRDSWIHFECQEFAAREFDKWQKLNVLSPYVTLWLCLVLFYPFCCFGESSAKNHTPGSEGCSTICFNREKKFLHHNAFSVPMTSEATVHYLMICFWDPVVLNEYLICAVIRRSFLYSSQGWTKEVTWQRLHFLIFELFRETTVDQSVSFLKHWRSRLCPIFSFWETIVNIAVFHISCDV